MPSLSPAFDSTVMPISRLYLLLVSTVIPLAAGCRESYRPEPAGPSSSSLSDGNYPPRTDFMVVSPTGIDGAPKHWNAPGWKPLTSARFPGKTPDLDLAEDIRKQLGKTVQDPTADPALLDASRLAKLLVWNFGVPAEPRVLLPHWDMFKLKGVTRPKPEDGLFANLEAFADALPNWKDSAWKEAWEAATRVRDDLKLDDVTLARGSVVYRRNCLQCHGITGAGDGAHAIELAAVPRDYRQGIFKFITAFPSQENPTPQKVGPKIGAGGKPRREDLVRTVKNGLDGTMMPAFSTLPEQDLEDVVSYVIHLSIRGETEFYTLKRALKPSDDDPDFNGPELDWMYLQNFVSVLKSWGVASRSAIPVPPENTPTSQDRLHSAIRGYKYYNTGEFGCAACHINYGREPALKWDLWGTVVQPRNFTLGVYRGGRRGEDLYARLYGGIYPSGMPAFHNTLKNVTGPVFPDRPDKIWDVVHFLQALGDPYQRADLKNPTILAEFKERMKAEGDLFLEDIGAVKIDP